MKLREVVVVLRLAYDGLEILRDLREVRTSPEVPRLTCAAIFVLNYITTALVRDLRLRGSSYVLPCGKDVIDLLSHDDRDTPRFITAMASSAEAKRLANAHRPPKATSLPPILS